MALLRAWLAYSRRLRRVNDASDRDVLFSRVKRSKSSLGLSFAKARVIAAFSSSEAGVGRVTSDLSDPSVAGIGSSRNQHLPKPYPCQLLFLVDLLRMIRCGCFWPNPAVQLSSKATVKFTPSKYTRLMRSMWFKV
jgi:hypothetical protein